MDVDLAAYVRRAAREQPDLADPKALVPFVMAEIQGQERELLERLLPREIAAILRRRNLAPDATTEERWDDFLEERLSTKEGYIFVKEASSTDMDNAALRRRSFAGNHDRRARRFAEVAISMRTGNAPTVAALSPEVGQALLRQLEERHALVRRQRLSEQRRAQGLEAAQAERARLQEQWEQGATPLLTFLHSHRQGLLDAIADTLTRIEAGEKTDTILEEYAR